MTYLKTIVYIFLAVSLLTIFYFYASDKDTPREDIAVTIDNRDFTWKEIDGYLSGRLSEGEKENHHDSQTGLVEIFASERVLLLEAEKQKIDQDPHFLEKIQRYYEHSLISALRSRTEKKIRQEITSDFENDINTGIEKFLDLYGREVTYSISTDQEEITIIFDALPNTIKSVIALMEPGETRDFMMTGNEESTISLIGLGEKGQPIRPIHEREKVRNMIIDYMIARRMNQWEQELFNNARITYHKEK